MTLSTVEDRPQRVVNRPPSEGEHQDKPEPSRVLGELPNDIDGGPVCQIDALADDRSGGL